MAAFVSKLVWSGFVLLFGLFGLGMIKFGRMVTEPVRAMEATETTRAADVTGGETVEVHGTARPATEGTVETPLYGADALAAVTRVQRRTGSGETRSWNTVHEETRAVPFVVADDTGEVGVVPPDDAIPTVGLEYERFGPGADPSPTVRAYVEDVEAAPESAGIDLGPVSMGARYRCGEGAIEPGDEVHVFGRTVTVDGADRGGVRMAITDGDRFVYSTVDQADLEASNRRLALLITGFGVLWVLLSVVFALVPWLTG